MTRNAEHRPWAVIPAYDNPATLRATVEAVRRHLPVVVVDDGSGAAGLAAARAVEQGGLARVVYRTRNGGKGAAVKTGFEAAHEAGATHALQIDADGQHDPADVPRFLEASAARPDALVLGVPVFDATLPRGRAWARGISTFWVAVETGGPVVADPQCGFRVYPLGAARTAGARGDHMEFDQEILVRMIWRGVPVLNLPTRVRYVPAAEGGVSHFRLVRDNARISWLHTRLAFASLARRARGAPLCASPPHATHPEAPSPRFQTGSSSGAVR